MAFQKSTTVRNAELDQIETTIGTTVTLVLFSGAEPANCAAADPSGVLATITLPTDWLANASAGVKAKAGTWSVAASASGTVAIRLVKDVASLVNLLHSTSPPFHYRSPPRHNRDPKI